MTASKLAESRQVLDLSIILPMYNEEAMITQQIQAILDLFSPVDHDKLPTLDRSFEIIVIDDGSNDASVTRVQTIEDPHVHLCRHAYNMGNGAAIKTGIRRAKGQVLVMLDVDGQHPPAVIPRLVEKIGPYDMVVGARTADSESEWYRDLANGIYNRFASYMCGHKIEDLTCGFRAIKADIARSFINLLPNTFSYPTTITMATVRSGYALAYVPFRAARRVGKSKIKLFQDGTRFLLTILRIATLFSPLKIFLPVSIGMVTLGFGYGLFKVVVLGDRYGPTSAMLMTIAVVVFLIGLVSEQITQFRFDIIEISKDHRGKLHEKTD